MIRCLIICFCLMGHSLANCVSWGSLTPLQQEVLVDYRSVWHLLLSEDQSVLEAGLSGLGRLTKTVCRCKEVYENWVRLSPEKDQNSDLVGKPSWRCPGRAPRYQDGSEASENFQRKTRIHAFSHLKKNSMEE